VGQSKQESRFMETRSWAMKAVLLAVVVFTVAGAAFHFAGSHSATASAAASTSAVSAQAASTLPGSTLASSRRFPSQSVPVSSISIPLFFEPNVGQTDSRVKFLARGAGYGLFLTSNDAVLSLQHPTIKGQPVKSNVIRMHLEGANSAAGIQGAEPLPGKSNYFIGNNPAKWHRGVSQFGRVEYQRVYPGVDLVYYGNQQQLEYDFRVAPGADPNQIALTFQGASAHLDSGDLVLSTSDGDVRFHAPRIYQPSTQETSATALSDATTSAVAGGFRQLAGNKIGFTVGSYDRSRELVIDPVLSYSTFIGGSGTESLASIAVDFASNIYVAGSTTSPNFPTSTGAIQTTLNGTENIFVAALSPLAGSGAAQLLFATYLGGSGIDQLGGVGVDPGNASFPNINIYVAGTTTSPNFPITANAFQSAATFAGTQTHGFLSTINASNVSGSNVFSLSYSTYLAGNANDVVTGVAVDGFFDAYVTGTTTSTDILTGFPSTANGYQICPWQPAASGGTPCPITTGPTQFFASEINTTGSGPQSMLYSTYFGGGYSSDPTFAATGGGIAVDVITNNPHSNVNMYFTGSTNMWGKGVNIPNGAYSFPLVNSWQSCLNQSGAVGTGSQTGCNAPGNNTDAFVAKLNPNQVGAVPTFSTFLGGEYNDSGIGVAVDNIGNTYVTGSTNSPDWNCTATNACTLENAFTGSGAGATANTNAFIAKVTNEDAGIFPLIFFDYIGGSGPDQGNSIAIDSVQAAHVAGSTSSPNLPVLDPLDSSAYNGGVYGTNGDAFVALVSTVLYTGDTGNYLTYLGGSALDEGTGIALDTNGNAYVAGATRSSNFPPANPFQSTLNGAQNAFVTELGGNSKLSVTAASGSPSPSPLPAGTQGSFSFNITNLGPDPATNVTFSITVPESGVQNQPSAEVVSSGAGSCTTGLNGNILCNVGSLAAGAVGEVAVFVTPSLPQVAPSIGVSGQASVNGVVSNILSQSVNITDFTISAQNVTPNINAGELAVIDVTLTPNQSLGYNSSVTLTQSPLPSMVTSPSPTFTINPVVLSGTSAQQTVLNIQTVPRPVNSGSLFRRRAFYAAWLPIGGLSLFGLGLGASTRRRRWLIGMLLGLLAGLILLQSGCGSGSSAVTSGGGTQPGLYQITITASAGTGAAHQAVVPLQVN
jgi:hypothetical protein